MLCYECSKAGEHREAVGLCRIMDLQAKTAKECCTAVVA